MSRACGMHTVGLLAPAFLCGSLYTSFQAYWPQLAKDRFEVKGQDGEEDEGPINTVLESISFGTFYLFALFTSLGADATMGKIGRKGTVVLGTIMTTIAAGLFIILSYVPKSSFIVVSIIARCLHGAGYGYVQTTDFAIFGIAYKDKVSLLMAFYEMSLGLGFSLGPIIGSALMAISGFTVLMVFFTAFGGICVFNSVVFIAKAEVDVKAEDEMDPLMLFEIRQSYMDMKRKTAAERGEKINEDDLNRTASMITPKEAIAELPANSYCFLFGVRRVLFASMSCFVLVVLFSYYEPLVSLHFTDPPFEVDPNLVGLIIAIPFFTYSISSFLSSKILQKVHCRLLIVFGFFTCGVSFLTLFGPSELLGFPNNLYMSVVGLALVRHFQGYIFVALIPELMEGIIDFVYKGEIPPEIADKLSVMFNFFFDFGGVIAPFIGNAMGESLGFRMAGDVMGLVSIGWAVILLIAVGDAEMFKLRKVEIQVPVVWSRALSNYEFKRKLISADF